jgi:hypothetical protein
MRSFILLVRVATSSNSSTCPSSMRKHIQLSLVVYLASSRRYLLQLLHLPPPLLAHIHVLYVCTSYICMYVCMYVYTYVCIYVYVCITIHCMYVYMYMHTHIYIYGYMYIHMYICVCVCICIVTHGTDATAASPRSYIWNTCMCVCVCVCVCIYNCSGRWTCRRWWATEQVREVTGQVRQVSGP